MPGFSVARPSHSFTLDCRTSRARRRRAGGYRDRDAQQPPAGERAVAEANILTLDTSMIEFYDTALAKYKRNMREHVPVVLALLSYDGGRLILYRPGKEPLEAASACRLSACQIGLTQQHGPLSASVAASGRTFGQVVARPVAGV